MIQKGKLEKWASDWKQSSENLVKGAEEILKGEYSRSEKKRAKQRLFLGKEYLSLITDLRATFGLKLNLRKKK